MYLKSYFDEEKGCLSYMAGCSATGEMAVIDPLESIGAQEYILDAAERGFRIVKVVDTHAHADHPSAARELAELAGAPLLMHASTPANYEFTAVKEGDSFTLGRIRFDILHTPGHTPESISLVVTDENRSEEPWLVFTGDTLFVGDVGRPDLVLGEGDGEPAERVGDLYNSIFGKLLALPDTVEIYPSHYGISPCGGENMSPKPSSTVGFERRYNRALQKRTPAEFGRFVLDTLRPQPEGYQDIKRANMGRSTEKAAQ